MSALQAPYAPQEQTRRARQYETIGLIKCVVRRVQFFEHDWAARVAGLVRRAQVGLEVLQFTIGMFLPSPSLKKGALR
jgi:hypothetical protein